MRQFTHVLFLSLNDTDWLHAIAAVGTAHLVCLNFASFCAESSWKILLSACDSTRSTAEQIGSAVHGPLAVSDHC